MGDNDLNSLLDKHFGPLPEPDSVPTLTRPLPDNGPTLTRHSLLPDRANELNKLAMKVKNSRRRAFLVECAWVCFKCNTLNGLSGNRVQIRKTCSKCAKPRGVEPSLLNEMTDHEDNF